MTKFLEIIADKILELNKSQADLVVVLPSQRAIVFLINYLQQKIAKPTLLPEFVTIDKLVEKISKLYLLEPTDTVLKLYKSYVAVSGQQTIQSFEEFSNWADTLIKDFHDIDRYLIEPSQVFNLLQDVEVLKRWELQPIEKTKLIEEQLQFWHYLPKIYHHFTQNLLADNTGYAGLLYKQACQNLKGFIQQNQSFFCFVGFNALSTSESKLIQTFLTSGQACVYWDIEEDFLNDPIHEVGYFLREIKKNWNYYKTHPFEWSFKSDISNRKIHVFSAPKTLGQAKLASNILSKFTKTELANTVLVLGDENALYPILENLPANVTDVNISMSFPVKQEAIQLLLQSIFKLHAIAFKSKQQTFYFKDLLLVISNPWLQQFSPFQKLKEQITKTNMTYVSSKWLFSFCNSDKLSALIFMPFGNANDFLQRLKEILHHLAATNQSFISSNQFTLPILYALHQTLEKISNQHELLQKVDNPDFLFKIYQQLANAAVVSFEGKPLSGLQIMGVLETRTLDFDNVVITNVNEGVFPTSKSFNSFIPNDLKLGLGLPTFYEKDAVFAYHFYHLIQRAKNVYIIYNNQSNGVFDSGEPSRFIHQLRHNKLTTEHNYTTKIPNNPADQIIIPKSEALMMRLQDIAFKGFSPTALASFLRDPKQFFFQRILSNKEPDDVEEQIAANTHGTIIHEVLDQIYKPFLNKVITAEYLINSINNLPTLVQAAFEKHFKEGNIKTGINFIALKVTKVYLEKFLQQEANFAKQNQVEILYLEQKFTYQLKRLNHDFMVNISGNIDRVDSVNGNIRVIDYKTGVVNDSDVKIKSFDNLFISEKEDKILQLSCYLLMLKNIYPNQVIQAGIISMRNLKFIPLCKKDGNKDVPLVFQDLYHLEFHINQLVQKILDQAIPFNLSLIVEEDTIIE